MLHFISILGLVLYCLSSYFYFKELYKAASTKGLSSKESKKHFYKRPRRVLMAASFCHLLFIGLHTYAEQGEYRIVSLATPDLISMICLFVVLAFLVIEKYFKVGFLGIFLSPLAAFVLLKAAILFHYPPDISVFESSFSLLSYQILTSVAICFFFLSFVVSVSLLFQELVLKYGWFLSLLRRLPSVIELERLNSLLLALGLVLFCFSLAFGSSQVFYVNGSQVSINQAFSGWLNSCLWLFSAYFLAFLIYKFLKFRGVALATYVIFCFSLLLINYKQILLG